MILVLYDSLVNCIHISITVDGCYLTFEFFFFLLIKDTNSTCVANSALGIMAEDEFLYFIVMNEHDSFLEKKIL